MIDFHVGEETMPSELLDLSGLQRSIDLACAEIDRLRAINAELRAVLRLIVHESLSGAPYAADRIRGLANDAIEKAEDQ